MKIDNGLNISPFLQDLIVIAEDNVNYNTGLQKASITSITGDAGVRFVISISYALNRVREVNLAEVINQPMWTLNQTGITQAIDDISGWAHPGTGAQGPPGPQGLPGSQGVAGPAGADSVVPGPQGSTGIQGAAGADSVVPGPTGAAGTQGLPGAAGAQGPAGTTGLQGAIGPAGADSTVPGPQGATGPQGLPGAAGAQGLLGNTGPQGLTGPQGADSIVAGPQGAQGIQGATGPQGPAGTAGAPGAQGIQGLTGNTGLQGNTGPQGIQGIQGIQGPAGPSVGTVAFGYGTGAGGTVVQSTSKSTGVTLSKLSGDITMNATSLAAAATASFTLTNTNIAATDIIHLQHQATGTFGAYNLNGRCAAGSAVISVRNNTAGALAEAIVVRFIVIKAVTA